LPKSRLRQPPATPPDGVILAGVGREGSSFVHGLDVPGPAVRKLFITGSPTRALAATSELLRIRNDGAWRDTLRGALAGSHLLVVVAAVTGREEAYTPDVVALARKQRVLAVAVLVEPLLSRSPHKSDAAAQLTRDVIKAADASLLFPAGPQAGSALTLSEAMARWTERLSRALKGLLGAACADNAMDMDFTDVAEVLSGHCRATVGAGRGKTVEDALRDAKKECLAPPAEVNTARRVFAHVIGDGGMPLDDARRVLPVLEHLFPKAEAGCGVAVDEGQDEIRATLIAGNLDASAGRPPKRHRTVEAESPFFKVGDPTVYDGENLDIPAFIRRNLLLPGAPPRPVPEQGTLFSGTRSMGR
jgi:cell division GTPase FtsZ